MSRIRLKCQGTLGVGRFLNGKTIEGTVDLVPEPPDSFSGTVWEMREVATDDKGQPIIVLRCEGASVAGKDDRFLDGHTADGTVALAPDNAQPFSGTQWSLIQAAAHPGFFNLRCGGTGTGDKRFLDGRTLNKTVGLIVDPTPSQFTGAVWDVQTL
ncbi:hypothetical protein [Streptomyces lavendulae]|uniref:hypothetical protein n=1 Tax=Streptomyces lavendulae TaxID=1914 RepID=UPI0037FF8EA6